MWKGAHEIQPALGKIETNIEMSMGVGVIWEWGPDGGWGVVPDGSMGQMGARQGGWIPNWYPIPLLPYPIFGTPFPTWHPIPFLVLHPYLVPHPLSGTPAPIWHPIACLVPHPSYLVAHTR